MFDKKAKPAEPVLTSDEAASPLWKKIKAHVEARLAGVRAKNDKTQPMDKTEQLRGRIAELKYLAALDRPAPQMEADDGRKE